MDADEERKLAHQIVQNGEDELKRVAPDRVLGNIYSFTPEEHQELKAFRSLVEGYIKLRSPPRPLCLAVFGPPGSGKTYLARQLCEDLEPEIKGVKLPFTEVNLTELTSISDLLRIIRQVRLNSDENTVPVIFFDEFDAPLAGVPLGWLSRLLAPMQEGNLFEAGERFELKRAVYIFAGGTAPRMADFASTPGTAFKEAKGPDFVSRLRGYIDVRGPNDPKSTLLRRAVLIRSALKKVAKSHTGGESAPISRELLDAMLDVGRYRHGSRSINAIIEMAAAEGPSPSARLELKHLPADHVLGVHRDLGPLDPVSIGGLIGLSSGHTRVKSEPGVSPLNITSVAVELAVELWKLGAVIGYGGKLSEDGVPAELLEQLTNRAKSLVTAAARLVKVADPPVAPPVVTRVEVFAQEKPEISVSSDSGMTTVPVTGCSVVEGQLSSLQAAVRLFRMRWMMTCRCVARVLISGKTSGFSGRMPGILEEAMLALALGQPLYVIGGFGGAAQVVGELLGIATNWPELRPVGCFEAPTGSGAPINATICAAPYLFRPDGFSHLPLTFEEAVAFMTAYAVGGPKWPPNGLSISENQDLFVTQNVERIKAIVRRGLTRRFQDYPAMGRPTAP